MEIENINNFIIVKKELRAIIKKNINLLSIKQKKEYSLEIFYNLKKYFNEIKLENKIVSVYLSRYDEPDTLLYLLDELVASIFLE